MTIDWSRIIPVIISICIIIAIAILRQYSKTFAAIAATMPIGLPLSLWIVASGSNEDPKALAEFSEALLLNIIPTLAFMVVAWQMTKAGQHLVPTIIVGYITWAAILAAVYVVRARLMP